jgi:hypothetical protein
MLQNNLHPYVGARDGGLAAIIGRPRDALLALSRALRASA